MTIQQLICNICGSQNCIVKPHKVFRDKLRVCKRCGLMFLYPQPSAEDLRDFYGKEYFQKTKPNSYGYPNYLKDRENITRTFQRRLRGIQNIWPQKGPILDVGCAAGFFLEVAKQEGWDPYGIEISQYAASVAQQQFGERVFLGTLFGSPFPQQFFDVITAWDYIEHVRDPIAELKQIRTLLKDSGLLVLSTPDVKSLPARITGDRWMGYKDKEHLYYFSSSTMRRALAQSGFVVVKEEHVGKYISMGFLTERFAAYSKMISYVLSHSIPKALSSRSFYMNPQDIICVYARKEKV